MSEKHESSKRRFLPGELLDDKYRIENLLGQGGMGAVYRATHLGTKRIVAVKVIRAEFSDREEFIERFRREAEAAGRLRHPNVVDVTDFGYSQTRIGQVAYLVMEYLDGCTLGEVLSEEPKLPQSWVVDILEQLCSAVDEAHRRGIVHRDLKPENIWLEPNRRGGYTVKVLDFGLVKLGASTNLDLEDYPAHQQDKANAESFGSTEKSEVLNLSQSPAGEETITMMSNHNRFGVPMSSIANASASDSSPAGLDIQALETQNPATDARQNLETTNTDTLTRVGSVMGTPAYMSPEQWRVVRTPAETVEQVRALATEQTDGQIAGTLNARWLRSPKGKPFTRLLIKHLRGAYGIQSYAEHLRARGWRTAPEIAAQIGVHFTTAKRFAAHGLLRAARADDRGELLFEPQAGPLPKAQPGKRLKDRRHHPQLAPYRPKEVQYEA